MSNDHYEVPSTMKLKFSIIGAILAMAFVGALRGYCVNTVVVQTGGPRFGVAIQGVYWPGYVDSSVKLAWFEPAAMKPACDYLEQHDFDHARRLFAARLAEAPNDPGAWLGLLQSDPNYRDQHLKELDDQARTSRSESNLFKLGILELYCAGRNLGDGSKAPTRAETAIATNAAADLDASYCISHNTMTGLVLRCAARTVLPDYRISISPSITTEDMLLHWGGRDAYRAFFDAKRIGWHGDIPVVPNMDANDLRVLKALLLNLNHEYGESGHYVTTRVKQGLNTTFNTVETPSSPIQAQAHEFFGRWITDIDEAISEKPM